jgi:cholesterol oxidase
MGRSTVMQDHDVLVVGCGFRHLLGGCVVADSPERGVVDPYHRVYRHPGLHLADGSAISANVGVRPALTLATQAERAMALRPNKGEADRRLPLGASYQHLAPTASQSLAVPSSAPAALMLPIIEVR